MILARVVRDAHFDSLTLRVRGRGRSYTERADSGAVMQGSFTEDRTFSEYWTLIRGAEVRGAPRADRRCPACGAEATFHPEGTCTSCGALVTTGDFDWIWPYRAGRLLPGLDWRERRKRWPETSFPTRKRRRSSPP